MNKEELLNKLAVLIDEAEERKVNRDWISKEQALSIIQNLKNER